MAQDHRIQWVYSSKTNEELEERYDQWAGEYDADLNDRLGWIGPRPAAEESARRGRRTRLVGTELKELGFTQE